jgi:non-specific serine/threonine protein kinase
MLSVKEILDKLKTSGLQSISGQRNNLPSRQKTLQSALEWSYNLTTAKEKSIFCAFSVFAESASYFAIEAVCGNNETEQPQQQDELENLIQSLLNKSLLAMIFEPLTNTSRYKMLFTVRGFARGKLSESAEYIEVKTKHADFYFWLSQNFMVAADSLDTSDVENWSRLLLAEVAEIKEMLQWYRGIAQGEKLLKAAAALWNLWLWIGYPSEGIYWLEQGYEMVTQVQQLKQTSLEALSTTTDNTLLITQA